MSRWGLIVLTVVLAACAGEAPAETHHSSEAAASGDRGASDAPSTGEADGESAKPWNLERAQADWAEAVAELSKDGLTREATMDALKSMRTQIGAVVRARIAGMSKLTELQQRIAALEATEAKSGDDETQLETLHESGRRARSELESIFEHVIEMKSSMVLLRLRIGGVAAAELDQLIYGLDAEQAHHVIPKVARNEP